MIFGFGGAQMTGSTSILVSRVVDSQLKFMTRSTAMKAPETARSSASLR